MMGCSSFDTLPTHLLETPYRSACYAHFVNLSSILPYIYLGAPVVVYASAREAQISELGGTELV